MRGKILPIGLVASLMLNVVALYHVHISKQQVTTLSRALEARDRKLSEYQSSFVGIREALLGQQRSDAAWDHIRSNAEEAQRMEFQLGQNRLLQEQNSTLEEIRMDIATTPHR